MTNYAAILAQEETLDPADWSALRTLAHQMVDDALDYLQTVGERPVWQKTPDSTLALTQEPLPVEGMAVEEVYAQFRTHIMPYTKGNVHPRFFAWVQGAGTATGALADLLASTMNPNATIGDHAAMYVDQQVINWCKQMLDFPAEASGILVSGGSVANITGITVARNAFDAAIRQRGLQPSQGNWSCTAPRRPIPVCRRQPRWSAWGMHSSGESRWTNLIELIFNNLRKASQQTRRQASCHFASWATWAR
jgi:hypothetical protein